MQRAFFQLIYPRRCPVCEKVLAPRDKFIHIDCRNELEFIQQPTCLRCGKPVDTKEQEYCFDCNQKVFHYIRGFPCIKYDKRMSKSISAFKYYGRKEYADFYVDELLHRYKETFSRMKFDVLVPVPIHKSKRVIRGYNQAELIAEGIGEAIGVEVDVKLLLRNKKTLPQKELDEKERLKNLIQAFSINKSGSIKAYQRVLLVDDIYTSGATIEACARILKEAGVKEVYYTSVCIGKGY